MPVPPSPSSERGQLCLPLRKLWGLHEITAESTAAAPAQALSLSPPSVPAPWTWGFCLVSRHPGLPLSHGLLCFKIPVPTLQTLLLWLAKTP